MLKALDKNMQLVLSWEAKREKGYSCPECKREVIYKNGYSKIEHFAHKPDMSCGYGMGESYRHIEMKKQVYDALKFPQTEIDVEVKFEGGLRRADVVVKTPAGGIVVECQASPISIKEWEARTVFYNSKGYYVLWIWDETRLGNISYHYSDGQVERRMPQYVWYCYMNNFGKVYYMGKDGVIKSAHPSFNTKTLVTYKSIEVGRKLSNHNVKSKLGNYLSLVNFQEGSFGGNAWTIKLS